MNHMLHLLLISLFPESVCTEKNLNHHDDVSIVMCEWKEKYEVIPELGTLD